MILAAALAVGLIAGLCAGGRVRSLSLASLRGAGLLLGLLVLQLALPLLRPSGGLSRVAYWLWLGSFAVMAAIAFLNRREPGMPIVFAALLLNALVIALNGGMPVSAAAVLAAGGAAAVATPQPGDFAHVVLSATTRLWWLGDVLPLPGPAGLAALISPGDVLLMAGVSAYVAGSMTKRRMIA